MMPISYAHHRFPPVIIQHAVWLYLRFTLSYRDVEDLLAERGLDISYETVRRWVTKFGPLLARELRARRPRPTPRWHLDEMVVTIAGKRFWLWRAVDSEGEILDVLIQSRRNTAAAVRVMRKLLRKRGFAPEVLITGKLRSYRTAHRQLGLRAHHEQGLRKYNRAELASASETPRAQDAAVQIAGMGSAFPVRPRSRQQHLQRRTSSYLKTNSEVVRAAAMELKWTPDLGPLAKLELGRSV